MTLRDALGPTWSDIDIAAHHLAIAGILETRKANSEMP